MALPIPSGIVPMPIGEFRRSTDILPPTAPVNVGGVDRIDPRTALQMPEPVVSGDSSGSAKQSLQSNLLANLLANPGGANEPAVSQAALLEISGQAGQAQANVQGAISLAAGAYMDNAFLPSLDAAVVAEQISSTLPLTQGTTSQQVNTLNILIAEALSQSSTSLTNSASAASNAVPLSNLPTSALTVAWPGSEASSQAQVMSNVLLANDPKSIFLNLKNDLKNSGLFAAEQLSHALMPAMDSAAQTSQSSSFTASTSAQSNTNTALTPQQLLQQLDPQSSSMVDAIRLALKGNLQWEGMLANQLPAKIRREDAWESNPNDPTQVTKGARITVAMNLPNLGGFTVVGIQFNDQIQLSMEVASTSSQAVFQEHLTQLQEQLQEQVTVMPGIQLTSQ